MSLSTLVHPFRIPMPTLHALGDILVDGLLVPPPAPAPACPRGYC